MNLANLTASGWVVFALAISSWIGLLFNLIALIKGQRLDESYTRSNVICVAVLTAWLLWLVTP